MTFNYTPNTNVKDKHKVLLKLQNWKFKAEFVVEMETNIRGLDIATYALEKLDLDFYNEKGERYELEFEDAEGNVLLLSNDDNEGEDWLKQYLVGYEVLEFESGNDFDLE